MGRRVGHGLLPSSKLLSTPGLPVLICLMASLSFPLIPASLLSLFLFLSLSLPLSLILLLSLSCFVFVVVVVLFCFVLFLKSVRSLYWPLLLSIFCLSSLCLFLYLSPLSLCLYFHVSLCVSFSPPQLSPRLPSLSLSLSTVKKAKFDGAQGKWPLFLSSPVLSVCLSISWRDGRGGLSQ